MREKVKKIEIEFDGKNTWLIVETVHDNHYKFRGEETQRRMRT